MRQFIRRFATGVAAFTALTSPAFAMHRQSPPAALVSLASSTADNFFPRLPPSGPGLSWSEGPVGSRTIYQVKLRDLLTRVQVSNAAGDNANVSCTRVGRYCTWENVPPTGPRAVLYDDRRVEAPLLPFAATNPAVTGIGNRVFFESTEDLDFFNGNPTHAQQIFNRFKNGTIQQVSRGEGTSGNPAAGKGNGWVAFDSTSDPTDGHDTGVKQIWFADAAKFPVTAIRVTSNALIPSENPQISADGALITFQSHAAHATDGHDTGVNQVFVYHVPSQTFAQVTNDVGGCEGAVIYRASSNYRVPFTCSGQPFFYDLRQDQRYRVPMPAGSHTAQVIAGLGYWFLNLSTTGNLLTNGLHPNHQLYVINMYKRPVLPVAGTATWFPFRGL